MQYIRKIKGSTPPKNLGGVPNGEPSSIGVESCSGGLIDLPKGGTVQCFGIKAKLFFVTN